jgi:hypothetical protein
VTSSLLTHTLGYLWIFNNAALTKIDLPSLGTLSGSYLSIRINNALATINLPSLSILTGYLEIRDSPSLTFVSLSKLTFIGVQILICLNNAAFTIPSGPPNAPTGGLVVTGSLKGTKNCYLQQGSGTCSLVTCP